MTTQDEIYDPFHDFIQTYTGDTASFIYIHPVYYQKLAGVINKAIKLDNQRCIHKLKRQYNSSRSDNLLNEAINRRAREEAKKARGNR